MLLRIGGHLSAKDGLRFVVMNAKALGYNAVQTMLGDPRDYTPWDISPESASDYRKMMYGTNTYVHMPYVINPCEDGRQRRGFYKATFKKFAKAAAQIGASALVVHPGFKKELDLETALRNLVVFMEETLVEDYKGLILLETDAGSQNGSAIGTLELIEEALIRLDSDQFGICIDTCHLFARGIDLWQKAERDQLLKRYGRNIKLVHLNVPDAEVSLGSFRDRHNSPFTSRSDWNHTEMINDFKGRYPMILERASLTVQEQDMEYIRKALKPETEE